MQADFPIVLDACVLANAGVCDLFLRLAERPRLYLPRWSSTILDEVKRTQMTKLKVPYTEKSADYWREQVTLSFPEALIEGFQPFIPQMRNPSKDRHVLAAAVKGNVSVIVTFNLRDFPAPSLKRWDVVAVHPQKYLLTLYSMNPNIVMTRLREIGKDHKDEMIDVLWRLKKSVPEFAGAVARDCGIPLDSEQ